MIQGLPWRRGKPQTPGAAATVREEVVPDYYEGHGESRATLHLTKHVPR